MFFLINRWTGAATLALLAGMAFASAGYAQIDVDLELEYKKALLHEPLKAYVKIANDSAQVLRLGGDSANASLKLAIYDNRDNRARRREQFPLLEEPVSIEPLQWKRLEVNMAYAYNIGRALPYTVSCIVKYNGRTYSSNAVYLDIVPGIPIKSEKMQMPGEDGEVRKYSLVYMYRDRKAKLYLRIENGRGTVSYGVYNLGDYIQIQSAEMRFDRDGNVHILHQSGPRRFSYYRFSRTGTPEDSKFYAGTPGNISLEKTESGVVSVAGGQEYEGDTYALPYEFDNNRVFE